MSVATHVVLVHPELHWDTGNAGRSCPAIGATRHLIAPLGFSLDEREVKRAECSERRAGDRVAR